MRHSSFVINTNLLFSTQLFSEIIIITNASWSQSCVQVFAYHYMRSIMDTNSAIGSSMSKLWYQNLRTKWLACAAKYIMCSIIQYIASGTVSDACDVHERTENVPALVLCPQNMRRIDVLDTYTPTVTKAKLRLQTVDAKFRYLGISSTYRCISEQGMQWSLSLLGSSRSSMT